MTSSDSSEGNHAGPDEKNAEELCVHGPTRLHEMLKNFMAGLW